MSLYGKRKQWNEQPGGDKTIFIIVTRDYDCGVESACTIWRVIHVKLNIER
jgi:hypothetical protein